MVRETRSNLILHYRSYRWAFMVWLDMRKVHHYSKDIEADEGGHIVSDMTFDEYQEKARRTQNPVLTRSELLQHALYGLCSEVGEIHGLMQKRFQGHPITSEHMVKEIGDALWMIAELCDSLYMRMGDVAQANIDKLRARYPEGFEVEKSLNRREGDV